MWHCHRNDDKRKHNDDPKDDEYALPSLVLTLPNDGQFTLSVWSLFWLVGPLLWWGTVSLQVMTIVILAALVLGVRVYLDDVGEHKRKNDDLP